MLKRVGIISGPLNFRNIVIIPSVSEGMSSVLFEAMATGNIVIATNVAGIPELIEDGFNGFLVDSQSSDRIIDVLKNLDTNSDNTSIAMAARKTIEHHYNDNFVCVYVKKYSQGLK